MNQKFGVAEVFRKILDDPQNTICFDCGLNDVSFCSLQLGILLCRSCANIHKSLIPEISEIVKLDHDFTGDQVQWLIMGGNASLKCFMAMYSICCNDSIEYKYRTKACVYYQTLLKMKVLNTTCTVDTPNESEGLELDEAYKERISILYSDEPYVKSKTMKTRRHSSLTRAVKSFEKIASQTITSFKNAFKLPRHS